MSTTTFGMLLVAVGMADLAIAKLWLEPTIERKGGHTGPAKAVAWTGVAMLVAGALFLIGVFSL